MKKLLAAFTTVFLLMSASSCFGSDVFVSIAVQNRLDKDKHTILQREMLAEQGQINIKGSRLIQAEFTGKKEQADALKAEIALHTANLDLLRSEIGRYKPAPGTAVASKSSSQPLSPRPQEKRETRPVRGDAESTEPGPWWDSYSRNNSTVFIY